MSEETKSRNVGTVLLSLVAGALLGAGIAFLVASQKEQNEDANYDEANLFV
jgi:formate/nitrite transporter FocA (FNT family)